MNWDEKMKLTTSKQNKIDFENLIVAQNEFEMDLRNNSIFGNTFFFIRCEQSEKSIPKFFDTFGRMRYRQKF